MPAGNYFLISSVNSDASQHESDLTNNLISHPVTITNPDLTISAVNAPDTTSTQQTIDIDYETTNQGSGPAVAGWYDRLYLSADSQLDAGDISLGTFWNNNPMAVGETAVSIRSVTIPEIPAGNYYIMIVANQSQNLYEADMNNNMVTRQIIVDLPDLVTISLDVPETASLQEQINVLLAVQNQGNASTSIGWYDNLYLSQDAILNPEDMLISSLWHTDSLATGGSYNATFSPAIPAVVPGTYYLIAVANGSNSLYESSQANNSVSGVIDLSGADLAVTSIDVSASTVSDGQQISLSTTVSNQGTGVAVNGFYVSFQVDGYNIGDQLIGAGLGAGTSVTVTQNWTATSGIHTLTVIVDTSNQVQELDETNNTMSQGLPAVAAPDLTVTNIASSNETTLVTGQQITLFAHVVNNGSATMRDFYVRFEADGNYLGRGQVPGGLGAGVAADISVNWVVQADVSGVMAIADEFGQVPESDENNNSYSRTLPPTVGPDLSVTDINFTPGTDLIDGQQVTLTATVQNLGASDTRSDVVVRFDIDGSYLGYQTIARGLKAGESVDINQILFASPGAHSVTVTADKLNVVTETDETNNSMIVSLPTVTSPDLIISEITLSPSDVIRDGESVTATARVINAGLGSTLRDFDIAFRIDDSEVQAIHISGGLASGEAIDIIGSWTASPGSHTLSVAADSSSLNLAGLVAESNESNNVFTTVLPTVPAADLAITEVSWLPINNVSDGDALTLIARIVNNGNDTLRDFYVAYKIDGAVIGYQLVTGGLGAGTFTDISATWLAIPGAINLTVIADSSAEYPAGVITESDETNNEFTSGPLPLITPADLVISDISCNPDAGIHDGDNVLISVTATNSGSSATPRASMVILVIDNYLIGLKGINGLGVGESATISFNWIASAGPHTIKARADVNGQVVEADEENNDLIATLTVNDVHAPTLDWITPGKDSLTDSNVANIVAQLSDGTGAGVDLDASSISVLKNGSAIAGTKAINVEGNQIMFYPDSPMSEGSYIIDIVASDLSSNSAAITSGFTVDQTPPVNLVGGVVDGGIYETSVEPTFTMNDSHPGNIWAELNGAIFVSGTIINQDGNYTLAVHSQDQAGNVANNSVNFILDVTPAPPVGLMITELENSRHLIWSANIEADISGYNVYREGILLNQGLVSGTYFDDPFVGIANYTVTAVDQAGHESLPADVTPLGIEMLSYGTHENGVDYATRGFVDQFNLRFTNLGTSPIDSISTSYELIDQFGNVYESITGETFGIDAGSSYDSQTQLAIGNEASLTLKVTANFQSGSQTYSVFDISLRNEPGTPLNVIAPQLTEGYADVINLELSNYGSAPLGINPGDASINLRDSSGVVISTGSIAGTPRWIGPGATTNLKAMVSTPMNTMGSLSVEVVLNTSFGNYIGEHAASAYNVSVQTDVRQLSRDPLTVYNTLVRGGVTHFTMTFLNQGTATLDVNPANIHFTVTGEDGTIYVNGSGNGQIISIAPNTTEDFPVDIQIPFDIPDMVTVTGTLGTSWILDDGITGPAFQKSFTELISDAAYDASAMTDKSLYQAGELITISGLVTSTIDGQPVPDVPVRLQINSRGFSRVFTVMAGADGSYLFVFHPLSNEAGKYTVGVTHPEVVALQKDTSFEIIGMTMTPSLVQLKMSQNSSYSIPITILNQSESVLTGITFSTTTDDDSGSVAATLDNGTLDLAPNGSSNFNLTVTAGSSTPSNIEIMITASSDQGSIANSHIIVELYPATPVAELSPQFRDTSISPGRTSIESVVVKNIGYGSLDNVVVTSPSLSWITSVSNIELGNIAPGAFGTFDVLLSPPSDLPTGVYEDQISVTSDNYETLVFPIRVTVSSADTGTLSLSVRNEFGDAIDNALVTLINQDVFTISFSGRTDAMGNLTLADIPIGRYNYQVSTDLYNNDHGTVVVESGAENIVEVVMIYDFLRIEWKVEPTTIQDQYHIVHEITYDTKAPVPYVKVSPEFIQVTYSPGSVTTGQLVFTNMSELLPVYNYHPTMPSLPGGVMLEFATDNIPILMPQETVVVPYTLRIIGAPETSSGSCGCQAATTPATSSLALSSLKDIGLGVDSGGSAVPMSASSTDGFQGITGSCEEGIKIQIPWNSDIVGGCEKCGYIYAPTNWVTIELLPPADPCNCLDALVGTVAGLAGVEIPPNISIADCCKAGIQKVKTAVDSVQGNYDLAFQDYYAYLSESLMCLTGGIDILKTTSDCLDCLRTGGTQSCQNCMDDAANALAKAMGKLPIVGTIKSAFKLGWCIGCFVGQLTDGSYVTSNPTVIVMPPVSPGSWEGWPGPGYKECRCSPEICIRIKLEIEQQATLERQAFNASLTLSNVSPQYDISDVAVDIQITDENGDPANDRFYITVSDIHDISDVEGSGVINPGQKADINWLIVPTPGAGGTDLWGKAYTVKAFIHGIYNTEVKTWETLEDTIVVEPMPLISLDYFLPKDVYGDDPMTVGIQEPVIPFVWGVRASNNGYGAANNFSIDSAQPKIVENDLGALIDFQLLGTWVNGILSSDTLKVDFGDIQPGAFAVAGWLMSVSHKGTFSEYTASFTHSDALGAEATSLIENVQTHILVHEFINDMPGQDNIFDFLVDNDDDGTPDLIYDSRGNDEPISVAAATITGTPTPQLPSATLTLADKPTGWIFSSVDDPTAGEIAINRIVRADGKLLNPSNYWQLDGKIYLVDDAEQQYLVYFDLTPALHAEFSADHFITTEGATVQFTDLSTGDLPPFTYEWDFNNDGIIDSTLANPAYAYTDDGLYTVTLKVTDASGFTDTAIKVDYISASNIAPIINPGNGQLVDQFEPINISTNFTDPGILDTHTATIDWGDGHPPEPGIVTEANGSGTVTGSHVYGEGGTYDISITVTDDSGSSAIAIMTVDVACSGIAPALWIDIDSVYWASYLDYTEGRLSVDYILGNSGGVNSYNVTLVGSLSTNDVSIITTLPNSVGDIAIGETIVTMLQYSVPSGVTFFSTKTYATAEDSCGNIYSYPGPYPGL